jgi:hypothetical protein
MLDARDGSGGWRDKDESDPRLLGHLRQFFNYGSCLTFSALRFSLVVLGSVRQLLQSKAFNCA